MARKPKDAPAEKKSDMPVKKAKAAEQQASKPAERSLRSLRDEIDSLFDSFEKGMDWLPERSRLFDEPFFEPFRRLKPAAGGKRMAADLVEDDTEFRINAELPGMAEEDIEVTFADDLLTIKAEKEEKTEEKDKDYHLLERRTGTFRRSFSLPPTVDADKINASLKNGVLSIVLPKRPEAKKETKKISVSTG